jgi:alkanesulfonate monooxygenase SsuD/methylene tetrahydromethanopterin reductase-like flavin-dependent oxidoreductase (luciferase family)
MKMWNCQRSGEQMKIGLCLPYMKAGMTRGDYHAWFRHIDQGPFHSLSCGERIIGPSYDMRILLAAAATLTEKMVINTTLYVLPMHNAVRAAKEIATLDVMCDGRLKVTVGYGGRPWDYQAVDMPYRGRHAKMDEQIATMKNIWAQQPPFEGVDPVGPIPAQSGGPQIYTGAMGPKGMARSAQWADGVYAFSGNGELSEIQSTLSLADDAWREAGREDKPYHLGGFWYSLSENAQSRLHDYVYNYLLIAGEDIANWMASTVHRSSTDAVKEALDNLEAAGCAEAMLSPVTADLCEIDRLVDILETR